MIVKFVGERKESWEDYLDTCVYAYNNTSRHESLKFSPFELMFGRKAVLPIELETATEDPEEVLKAFHAHEDEGEADHPLWSREGRNWSRPRTFWLHRRKLTTESIPILQFSL